MENKPISPCTKDCPRRKAGCGSTCPDWKNYVTERDKMYEQRRRDCLLRQIPRKRGRYDRD